MSKKQYVEIDLKQGGKYVKPATKKDVIGAIEGELDGLEDGYCETGLELKLTVLEMAEEEYKALPEFTGH